MRSKGWQQFIRRFLIAGAIVFLVAVGPLSLWTPSWFVYWQVPVVVLLFICYVGKLLIETIVYPRMKV